jgi:hypothetical protein
LGSQQRRTPITHSISRKRNLSTKGLIIMNDQLQAQLAQILAQIMVSVGEVKDYSLTQLPDIAQQYITYGIWKTGITSALLFILVIVSTFVIRFGIKLCRQGELAGVLATMISFTVGLSSLIGFFHNLHSFILVMTAPKVWFIMEIKNLLS